ncbi:MAG: amidoligase enzyme [Rhodospirillales bacterium]|nr:MAG: amidoligase enzyme [Rhodospirillales bacterium]
MSGHGVTDALIPPPKPTGADGKPRHIGVEVEFAGIDCRRAAELVQERFGGELEELDPYRFRCRDSRLGDFLIELDSRYAHPPARAAEAEAKSEDEIARFWHQLEADLHSTIGDIGSLWLPVEIVTAPIALEDLPVLDRLTADLRAAGARGTDEGLFYAFATQLNPEVPSRAPDDILRHLQAYIILAEGLRQEIDLDVKRQLLPFASPFPRSYQYKVLEPDYRPSLADLVDDYVEANPTRNRELDLLPLFAEIAPERVHERVRDPLIKARPTFHYRLPDTRLTDPTWGIVTEWNRWVRVERLAADSARLAQAAEQFLSHSLERRLAEWGEKVRGWFQ